MLGATDRRSRVSETNALTDIYNGAKVLTIEKIAEPFDIDSETAKDSFS